MTSEEEKKNYIAYGIKKSLEKLLLLQNLLVESRILLLLFDQIYIHISSNGIYSVVSQDNKIIFTGIELHLNEGFLVYVGTRRFVRVDTFVFQTEMNFIKDEFLG